MSDMDILLPKLLVQTLAETPQSELARAEQAGGNVAPPRSSRSSEDQCAFLPRPLIKLVRALTQRVLLERQNRGFSKCERADHVRVRRLLDLLIRDLEERLPHGVACVPNRDANLGVELCFDCSKGSGELRRIVLLYGERGRFAS